MRRLAVSATIAVFTLALTAASGLAAHRWTTYHNPRFGTEADVPADLFTDKRLADNGDGATFRSADGAKLLVFGSWFDEPKSPAAHATRLRANDALRYAHVSYERVGKGFLVLSGVTGDRIYYERYRFDDPSGARHAMVLEYPSRLAVKYGPVAARISASLKWTRPTS